MSYYTNLYAMPCRKPCNRYTGPNDVFEAEAVLIESTIPAPEGMPVPPASSGKTQENFCPMMFQQQRQRQSECDCKSCRCNMYKKKRQCNCRRCQCNFKDGPTVSREGYDYDSRVFNEGYEYEPTISREGYSDNGNGGSCSKCTKNNPPYRAQSCNYNQSPSSVTQNMFKNVPVDMVNMSYAINGLSRDQSTGPADCGCSASNPPYQMEGCGYNNSPTWTDQASFRENVLNKN